MVLSSLPCLSLSGYACPIEWASQSYSKANSTICALLSCLCEGHVYIKTGELKAVTYVQSIQPKYTQTSCFWTFHSVPMTLYMCVIPLQGGGQMVLVFYNELPPGNKFVTFFSQKRNSSITVDTTQENAMVLYALIPSE